MDFVTDEMDFSAYMAEPEAKEKVVPALSFLEQVRKRFENPEEAKGKHLPWPKTAEYFRIRPNELTLWPGINGHGKSLVLNQIQIGLMAQGEKILIASMEMPPAVTLERMTRQACGMSYPSATEVDSFLEWTNDRCWIYDHLGSVNWKNLIGVMRYCAVELGITQFVVDSLMRCGIGEQDYDGQKAFIDALVGFKNQYPVHVHLVMHSRKRENEDIPPGKFDAKGTGTMTDLADNVVTVWRNKKKERAIQDGTASLETTEMFDALMIVDKQRNYEWEGKIALWYIPGAMQFVENGTSGCVDLTRREDAIPY